MKKKIIKVATDSISLFDLEIKGSTVDRFLKEMKGVILDHMPVGCDEYCPVSMDMNFDPYDQVYRPRFIFEREESDAEQKHRLDEEQKRLSKREEIERREFAEYQRLKLSLIHI